VKYYKKLQNDRHRQVCLDYLIRKVGRLAGRANDSYQRFRVQLKKILQQLCGFAHVLPGKDKLSRFYTRLMLLLLLFEATEDDAGRLAQEVLREIDSL
jgi:hypothetical protein